MDLSNVRAWTRELWDALPLDGGKVIDATVGNGYDTVYLAGRVGEKGTVWGFDVQEQALEAAKQQLRGAGLLDRCRLIKDSHENVDLYVSEPVDGVMFNLGWLPGTEHVVTTQAPSTIKAVNKCLRLLKKGGLMTVCVYPGHPEGEKEKVALLAWAEALDDTAFDARVTAYLNITKRPPLLIAVARRK
ncbi:MAG: methyltransferase domain-containing protein [Clostridiales bacterium]|nr:methyltransferase domain-containing protein [Clostridiales bacterium]